MDNEQQQHEQQSEEHHSQKPELDAEEHEALIEALVFAHGEPVSLEALATISGFAEDHIKELLGKIKARFDENSAGVELLEMGSRFQFRTRNRFAAFVRELKLLRPRKLSQQALETLAIVAYRQPIVKSDIEKLRGVDATPTLNTLLERKLICIMGHQASVGSPALYGTTDEFLKVFGLRSIADLPSPRDLKELEDPGETPQSDRESPAAEISI